MNSRNRETYTSGNLEAVRKQLSALFGDVSLSSAGLSVRTAPAQVQGDTVALEMNERILLVDFRVWNTLRRTLAILYLEGGSVRLRYPNRHVDHHLARVVTARFEDYWRCELKDTSDTDGSNVLDYRRCNIQITKTEETKAHDTELTAEDQRNFDKPNRMFQIGGKRVNQAFDSNSFTADPLPEKPVRPKGESPYEDAEGRWADGLYSRGEALTNKKDEQIGEARPQGLPKSRQHLYS